MLYMDNPPRTKRRASTKKPTRKQLAARAKFAAAARAKSRAAKSTRVTSQENPKMKKRKRKSTAVARVGASSPRRRRSRKRRSYRRNPPSGMRRSRSGIMPALTGLAIDTIAGTVGMGIGHLAVTKIGPSIANAADTPTTAAGKRFGLAALIAAGVVVLGEYVAPGARSISKAAALGIMLPATRDFAVAAVPESSDFLGDAYYGRRRAFAGFAPPDEQLGAYMTPNQLGAYMTPNQLGDFSEQGWSRSPFEN